VIVPGRQVVDAARVVRAAPERFSDYTLETVASSVLGRGKTLEQLEGENKVASIRRLYREDPISLCRYCLEDAKLVIGILEETGLLDLTVRRSMLIGVGLDRAWTSIAAFDHIYIEAMHQRHTVAPTLGVDTMPAAGAPGGAILGPQSGLYENVWLFDFKSLYPSIILTFNIDPLSYVTPHDYSLMGEAARNELIDTPNGAHFRREGAILPDLLQRFFQSRDEAKKRGDAIASYVYKIIMNSFYGVLGAAGSRFASGFLAGAITSMGQHLLHWCEKALSKLGYRVVYGDTDSLFVLSGLAEDASSETILQEGTTVCRKINAQVSEYIGDQYGLTPHLELEFEKIYYRFFLPPIRSSAAATEANSRGRAKGYAGLTLPVAELKGISSEDLAKEPRLAWIDIKGMEAVRRDWTDLAQGFQVGLLELAFRDEGLNTVKLFIQNLLENLRSGKLDRSLVYRKALRKPVSEYTRTQPPHVRAAAMLEPEEQTGLIEYIMTHDGPQPLAKSSSPIDYEHYVEKQLKPIAQGFEEAYQTDVGTLFGEGKQLELF
jgi:DNA polymerase-2